MAIMVTQICASATAGRCVVFEFLRGADVFRRTENVVKAFRPCSEPAGDGAVSDLHRLSRSRNGIPGDGGVHPLRQPSSRSRGRQPAKSFNRIGLWMALHAAPLLHVPEASSTQEPSMILRHTLVVVAIAALVWPAGLELLRDRHTRRPA